MTIKVFMVAEKPILANSIAKILSKGNARPRKGFNGACTINEWIGPFTTPNGKTYPSCSFAMTSVCGHVFSLDFNQNYQNWETTDPLDLFSCETITKEATPKLKMPQFLQKESSNSSFLVLWLDCDKEGENICFEVIDCVKSNIRPPPQEHERFFRARFSSLAQHDIWNAFNKLSFPNESESLSVEARKVLDLRIGCAFTRYQSRYFNGKYGDLDSRTISFGPCQTPTLGFCVKRHDRITEFKAEKYYYFNLEVCDSINKKESIFLLWKRKWCFCQETMLMINEMIKNESIYLIDKVQSKKKRTRPSPLNTVDLLKLASTRLGMSPQQTMLKAEHLYTRGFISYPRTETSKYTKDLNLPKMIDMFQNDSADHTHQSIIDKIFNPINFQLNIPQGGHDAGDHPPITPMMSANREMIQDGFNLYDLIVRHFIATLSPNCQYNRVVYSFQMESEYFHYSTDSIINEGYLLAYDRSSNYENYQDEGDEEDEEENFLKNQIKFLNNLSVGDKVEMKKLEIKEDKTRCPNYLTEHELISLMDENGIGTDASIAVHIATICERNYVRVEKRNNQRYLIPTKLGIILIHGYYKIDTELCNSWLRSEVEKQLNLIAKNLASYQQVRDHTLEIFKKKFQHFMKNIDRMDDLFEASFTTLSASGKAISRCGICTYYLKHIATQPQRLHCPTCNDTYNLPTEKNVNIKLFQEKKCPLDEFQLLLMTKTERRKRIIDNRNQYHDVQVTRVFCPYCYSRRPPPYMKETMQQSYCVGCSNDSCEFSIKRNEIMDCCLCEGGKLFLDRFTPPKFRINCNNCSVNIDLFWPAFSFEANTGSKANQSQLYKCSLSKNCCAECQARLISLEFHKNVTVNLTKQENCLFCDEIFDTIKMDLFNQTDEQTVYRNTRGRGGRGRGRGGRRGGRGGKVKIHGKVPDGFDAMKLYGNW